MNLDEKCSVKEQDALCAIIDYMKKQLNGKIQYTSPAAQAKQDKEMISIPEEIQDFWVSCTQTFMHDIDSLFTGSLFEFESEEDMVEEVSGHWVDAMEDFKYSYEYLKSEYGINSEQEAKCDDLFSCLCNRIERTMSKEKKISKDSLIKATHLNYLPHFINLKTTAARELLPYLLTAYTANSWNSRFLYSNRVLISLICSTGADSKTIGSIEAPKMRARIKTFSQVFSLERCKEQMEVLPKSDSTEKPIPFCAIFYKMTAGPYIKYKEVLDQVFEIWCRVVYECAPLAGIEEFPSDIDWDACQKLYSSYTTTSRN